MITATDLLTIQLAAARHRHEAAWEHPLVRSYIARQVEASNSGDLFGSRPVVPFLSIEEAVAVTLARAAGSELYRLEQTANDGL